MTIAATAQVQQPARDSMIAAERRPVRQAGSPADAATAVPFLDVLRMLAGTTDPRLDAALRFDDDRDCDEMPVQAPPPVAAGMEPGFPREEAVSPPAAVRADGANVPPPFGTAVACLPAPASVPPLEAAASPLVQADSRAARRASAPAAVPATPRASPDPVPASPAPDRVMVRPAADAAGAPPPSASAQRLGVAAGNAVDRLRFATGLNGDATASELRAGSPGAQAPAAALASDRAVTGGEAGSPARSVVAGAPHWQSPLQQALGERLRVEIGRTREQATVRLDPPSLGRIEILVRHEGAVLQVHLSASNGEVARQLGPIVEQLRQDLAQRHPGEVTVTVNDGSRDSDARQRGALPGNEDETPHRALDEGGDEAPASSFALAGRNRST